MPQSANQRKRPAPATLQLQNPHAINVLPAHLLRRTLLNRDQAAIVQLRVDGCGGRRHKEGHIVVVCGHRVAERANLVGCRGMGQRRGWVGVATKAAA